MGTDGSRQKKRENGRASSVYKHRQPHTHTEPARTGGGVCIYSRSAGTVWKAIVCGRKPSVEEQTRARTRCAGAALYPEKRELCAGDDILLEREENFLSRAANPESRVEQGPEVGRSGGEPPEIAPRCRPLRCRMPWWGSQPKPASCSDLRNGVGTQEFIAEATARTPVPQKLLCRRPIHPCQ